MPPVNHLNAPNNIARGKSLFLAKRNKEDPIELIGLLLNLSFEQYVESLDPA
jgi:hypothetical protein